MQAFGGMFCLSGLLGIYGSCATLAGYCMSRHFGVTGINVFKLKVTIMGFNQSLHMRTGNTKNLYICCATIRHLSETMQCHWSKLLWHILKEIPNRLVEIKYLR